MSSRAARSWTVIDFKRWTALACLLVLVPLGCSAPPRTAAKPTSRSACAVVATGATAPESISVAASTAIDRTHVPFATTAAERFAFAQLYETLIGVDCEGRAYPGLARSWTMDATRTRVTLMIREGARFARGKLVVASDVVAAWRATGGQSTNASELARRVADATTVLDDHTLTVSLPDTAWLELAEPALAVYRPQSGPAWAEGSGPYQVDSGGATDSQVLTLSPVNREARPRIVIRTRISGDARDAIDAGTDLVVTGDPVAVNYAATRGDLAAIPLPWSRTYALAVPDSTSTVAAAIAADAASPTSRASLARDAVRGEARASEPPDWWIGVQGCSSMPPILSPEVASGDRRPNRIVYSRDDRVARALAERLVALDGASATAAGLAPADFARSLRVAQDLAYVLDLPRLSLSPCRDLELLASTAPWVAGSTGDTTTAKRLVPLVDTRQRAIVRTERVSAAIDWDGTLRVGSAPRTP